MTETLPLSADQSCIRFVLDILWRKNKDKPGRESDYADAVIEFFDLDNRFYVNALIFKEEMNHMLPEYIQRELKSRNP